jgi:hypothetical protein
MDGRSGPISFVDLEFALLLTEAAIMDDRKNTLEVRP